MKYFLFVLSLGISFVFTANSFASNNYICMPIQSTGFYKDGGSWAPTIFFGSHVYKITILPSGIYDITRDGTWFGISDPEYNDTLIVLSNNAIKNFTLNKETMRFTASYFGGYIDNSWNNRTPYIEIGTCKIDN